MILTRQDLSDPENVKDCVRQIRAILETHKTLDDMALAHRCDEFFENWGEAICARIQDDQPEADLERAEEEATRSEDRASQLESAIEEAISAMDAATELKSEARAKAFEEVAADLEKALTK